MNDSNNNVDHMIIIMMVALPVPQRRRKVLEKVAKKLFLPQTIERVTVPDEAFLQAVEIV